MQESQGQRKVRIGVYVCHCGSNIAGVVDCAAVAAYGRDAARTWSYPAMTATSVPSRARTRSRRTSGSNGLNRIVVASCSPRLHEPTFRKCRLRGGAEPLPAGNGQPSRAMLLGALPRSGRSDPEVQGPGALRGGPGPTAGRPRGDGGTRSSLPRWSSAAAWQASRPLSIWPIPATTWCWWKRSPASEASWPGWTRPIPPWTVPYEYSVLR